MKAKTVKAVLRKKFNEWVSTIDDPEVRKLVEKNSIITGGAIVSMLLNEPVNDYDVYFTDRDTALKVAGYYVSKFPKREVGGVERRIFVDDSKSDRVSITITSAGVASKDGEGLQYQYFESMSDQDTGEYVGELMSDEGEAADLYEQMQTDAEQVKDEGEPTYRPVFMSTNAITLSNKIQIVLRFFGDAEQLHENYDFVHCTNYWTSSDGDLVLRPRALEAMLAKELVYVGSKYPVCSIIRLRKFIRRGWQVNAGQILKMVMQVNDLDLKDIEVLRDQLTGVDSAYFVQVIDRLKAKDPNKVNTAYLIEIIDRMF